MSLLRAIVICQTYFGNHVPSSPNPSVCYFTKHELFYSVDYIKIRQDKIYLKPVNMEQVQRDFLRAFNRHE